MIKSDRAPVKVTVNIKPGPVSPAQKQAWRRFWQKLIAQVQEEVENG